MNPDDLKKRFKHHPPQSDDQIERYATVRNKLLNLAIELDEMTGWPDSREKSLAVTAMEEAMFWWNAHIARSEARSNWDQPNADPLGDLSAVAEAHMQSRPSHDHDSNAGCPVPRCRLGM